MGLGTFDASSALTIPNSLISKNSKYSVLLDLYIDVEVPWSSPRSKHHFVPQTNIYLFLIIIFYVIFKKLTYPNMYENKLL